VQGAWQQDPIITDLVARLAARRTPLEEAEKAISDFIGGKTTERQQKAKLIFAGLFESLNQERSRVMNGIERFSRLQKGFADQIRSEIRQLRYLQNMTDGEQGKVGELADRI